MEREEGFTIIEMLIASTVLILGSLAVFMTFAAAVHNVQRGRENQVGISVAQREMERLRVVPFASLGMVSTPTFKSETKSPFNRIRISGGKTQFDLLRSSATDYRNLKIGGEIAPETKSVKSNDGTEVTVFRFVVCEEESCHSKRIVIDVLPTPKANLGNYQHAYHELQSTVVDPALGS